MNRPRRHVSTLLLALSGLTVASAASAADPTTSDCLTANASAARLRNEHKLRAAREQLLVCAAQSCPGDVQAECARRVMEVNASIPTIVFEVKDPAGNDLTAVSVSIDGKSLVERLEGTAISLDPGQHTFTFETSGQPPVDKVFMILEGQKDRRERVVVGTATSARAPVPLVAPAPPSAVAPAPSPAAGGDLVATTPEASPVTDYTPATSHTESTLKTAGLVTGGVGVLGLVLGSVFGVEAISKKNEAACDASSVCTSSAAASTLRSSRSAGNLSTAFVVAGGVLGAAGVTLWVVGANHRVQASAELGSKAAGVSLSGSWQ